MNGNSRPPSGDDHDDGLDLELLQLFDAAATTLPSAAVRASSGEDFVNALLLRIQHARRLRVLWQVIGVAAVLVPGAFLAPYMARQTLLAAGWFTDGLPATGTALVSPIGLLCAAVVAWRVTRAALR